MVAAADRGLLGTETQGNFVVPPHPPTPPPIPAAPSPPQPSLPSRRTGVPAWATSFGVHCLAIIILGLCTNPEKILGTKGLLNVAMSWQESSGDDKLDLDSGALRGDLEAAVQVASSQDAAEFSAATLDRFAQSTATPAELQLEVAGLPKAAQKALPKSVAC